MVPANEMTNHLKVLLLDPKWKEQKERFIEKARAESALSSSTDIEGNIAEFIGNRPDIFGSLTDEVNQI